MKKRPDRIDGVSPIADIWYRLKKNKAAMAGLFVVTIIVLLAIFAGVIADYDTDVIMIHADSRLLGPSAEHWFGTDASGRDIFARVIYGARYSLIFGLGCTAIAMCIGGILGSSAAYFGGKVDAIITFVVDSIICIPSVLLSLSMVAVLGPGFRNLMIAITISSVPGFTRVIRSIVLGVTGQEYIEAAKAIGVSNGRIIFAHVLPNAVALIIVNATMNIAGLIIAASSLSFIGMGIQPPAPEWGSMLTDALQYLRTAPHVAIFPGLAILLTALSFNLLGDGLSEALDPRMRG